MNTQIGNMVRLFEQGTISRRQLIAQLTLLTGLGAANVAGAQEEGGTFKAVGLNHIALRVPDVQRSRDFYRKHLGMTVTRDSASSCFLSFPNGFLALFRGDQPGMDHYCYSVEGYSVGDAVEKLREQGLNPRNPAGSSRVYFPDPDGLTVQLSAPDHTA